MVFGASKMIKEKDMLQEILKGKKLLVLAGGPNLISLVKRAQYYGVYVIVTDYYDNEKSPAKKIADEAWDISWNDIDTLEKKCRENNIDGITTGYSESPVEACIELCNRLGLPCYCNKYQLDFTRDKILFKEVCRECGVPTVQEYPNIDAVDSFPVIVKPVDRAGSIGISIAHDYDELVIAYNYAMEMSYNKHVIIEKYITGTKIDLYYEIIDGNIELVSTDDVINAAQNGSTRVVQSCWLFPSKIHSLIKKETNEAFCRLINKLGITNGYIFFSGFEDHGSLMFFESGFRLCGGHIYEYLSEKGNKSNLDIFIFHALTGSTDGIQCPNKLNLNLKCVTINVYSKSGIINEIAGFDQIREMKDCKFALVSAQIGQICTDDKAILTKVGMFYFCNEDSIKLQQDVENAYKVLRVIGRDNEDLIYDKIDYSVISSWWN